MNKNDRNYNSIENEMVTPEKADKRLSDGAPFGFSGKASAILDGTDAYVRSYTLPSTRPAGPYQTANDILQDFKNKRKQSVTVQKLPALWQPEPLPLCHIISQEKENGRKGKLQTLGIAIESSQANQEEIRHRRHIAACVSVFLFCVVAFYFSGALLRNFALTNGLYQLNVENTVLKHDDEVGDQGFQVVDRDENSTEEAETTQGQEIIKH